MNKFFSQVCLVILVVLGLVLVNAVIVQHVAGFTCPHVGVKNEPCIEDDPYDDGNTDGACVIDIMLCQHAEPPGLLCGSGRLVIHDLDRLKTGVHGSMIIDIITVPCYDETYCEGPFLVTNGTVHPNDLVVYSTPFFDVRRYRCVPQVISMTAMSLIAGPCPE